jgi:glycosyltransferase involved in cell wall biosynthesis
VTKLSVIVPCFNSAETLPDAVESIYRQEPGMAFDVTLVDDGSTDSTYDVMRELAAKHPRMKLLRHPSNLGGGAARNTAAANSDGDLIFCVDSDDILGQDCLRNLIGFWRKKRCDGLGISTSIMFRGHDVNNVAYTTEFEGPGKRVRFESFLEGSRCSLNVVFMITRKAFALVGGYPTEHGLDTQGLAFRFLCTGLAGYTCPDTKYYHRVGLPRSYYMREQEADRLNWNWLNVFDEFLYVFRSEIRQQLLESDLFWSPGKPAPARLSQIVQGQSGIYAPGYRRMVRKGPDAMAREFARTNDGFKQYWLGNYHRLRGSNRKALDHYSRSLAQGFQYRMVYYRILQASVALSGRKWTAAQAIEELKRYSQPFPITRLPIRERFFRRLIKHELLGAPVLAMKSLRDRVLRRVA